MRYAIEVVTLCRRDDLRPTGQPVSSTQRRPASGRHAARLLTILTMSSMLAAAHAQSSLNWNATGASPTAPSSIGNRREEPVASPATPARNAPNAAVMSAPPASALTNPARPSGAATSTMPSPAGSAGSSLRTPAGAGAAPALKGLFALSDATPVSTGGRTTTAGELKQRLTRLVATKSGPPHTVRAAARAVAPKVLAAGKSVPVRSGQIGGGLPGSALRRVDQTPSAATVGHLFCTDNGPPSITEIDGALTPGGTARILGYCFGDRIGRVEVIGNFPGGKIDVTFSGWSKTDIDLQVPPNVRNSTDGTVAVTVVGADGRRSAAMQASFVAARETVEVPARLWAPQQGFALSASNDVDKTRDNPAMSGNLARSLRINPQCALTTMSVDVVTGNVSQIQGFDQGPPNEAAMNIAWTGTCVYTVTTYRILGAVVDSDDVGMCSVALQPRAWASCPVGVSP